MAAVEASYEELSSFEEKEADEDATPMTEEEAEKITKQIQDKENELNGILNELKKEENDLSVIAWFEGVSNIILYSQATETKALGGMKDQVKKSIAAYKHFETIVNDKEYLRDHKERVDAAREIYRKYWSILGETGSLMTTIVSKVDRILRSIETCKRIAQRKDNKLPTPASVRMCIKAVNEWILEQEKLANLHNEWRLLGDAATKEQVEWKKIENEMDEKYKKQKKTFGKILIGLGIVATIALCATGIGAIVAVVAAPVGAVLLGVAGGVAAAGLSVVAAYFGVELRKSYLKFKAAQQGVESLGRAAKHAKEITSTMEHIAKSASKFDDLVKNLNDICVKTKNETKDLEDQLELVKEAQKDKDIETENDCLSEIFQILQTIPKPLQDIRNICNNCVKEVDSAMYP